MFVSYKLSIVDQEAHQWWLCLYFIRQQNMQTKGVFHTCCLMSSFADFQVVRASRVKSCILWAIIFRWKVLRDFFIFVTKILLCSLLFMLGSFSVATNHRTKVHNRLSIFESFLCNICYHCTKQFSCKPLLPEVNNCIITSAQ